jgi:Uncharacterized conserved protein
MELSITTTPLPLVKDDRGMVRVGGTRVTLETVVTAFKNGSTCEEIVYQYPSLKLADVYAVISYYLNNQAEVEAYLEERQKKAEMIRKKIESNFDSQGIRERLLKRRAAKNG